MSGRVSPFLLVSFKKSKTFHPSLVKLKETHVKPVLLNNQLQYPQNYFRDEFITLRGIHHDNGATDKHDYNILRNEHLLEFWSDAPIGFKAHCSFGSTREDYSITELKLKVVLTDFFGKRELLEVPTHPNFDQTTFMKRFGKQLEPMLKKGHTNFDIEWNCLGWSLDLGNSENSCHRFPYLQNEDILILE